MCEWTELVTKVAAVPLADDSIRALLHAIAEQLDKIDYYEESIDGTNAAALSDDLADMSYALRAKTEDLIEAIMHKPPPKTITLPDQS